MYNERTSSYFCIKWNDWVFFGDASRDMSPCAQQGLYGATAIKIKGTFFNKFWSSLVEW